MLTCYDSLSDKRDQHELNKEATDSSIFSFAEHAA